MHAKQKSSIALILFAAVLWSIGGLLIKLLPWTPISIVGIRGLIGAITLMVVSRSFKIDFKNKTTLFVGFCQFITCFCFVFANKMTTAANAIVLQQTAIAFIILFNYILFKQKPIRADIFVVLATMAGIVFFFMGSLEPGQLLGNIIALVSGVSNALAMIYNARNPKPIDSSVISQLMCAAVGMPFFVMGMSAFDVGPVQVSAVLGLGIVQIGLGQYFYSKGVKYTPALLTSILAVLEPLLSPLWVLLVLREKPGIWAFVGFIIVMTSGFLYSYYILKNSGMGKEAAAEEPELAEEQV